MATAISSSASSPNEAHAKTTNAMNTPAADPAAASAGIYEDSRSETSTVDTDVGDEQRSDLSSLTFFTRLYELPIVSDTISNIYRIAESNKYTKSIIGYAEKAGGYAEKSLPLLKPVEKPLVAIDGYATRSLDIIETKYPIVGKPTSEVIETIQSQARAVEEKYPIVARTFAVAKSTTNSALDRVDYLVDYVLPPKEGSAASQPNKQTYAEVCLHAAEDDAKSETATPANASATTTTEVESPIEKVTILVHKVPQRVGRVYYDQLQASKSAIGGIQQSVKDTVNVYESEISERSNRLLDAVQERLKTTVNTTIPNLLPQFIQPYYVHSKDVLATKAEKLHTEYSRTEVDTRTKVLNLILISGEQVPVLERITSRVFGKGMGISESEPAVESDDTVAVNTAAASPSIKSSRSSSIDSIEEDSSSS
ncbi:hypothetical protein LPJ73_004272 [Coemansia sp. RSA 2703]|nr:hypothetical protein LPJ73_004272 [Coemansia sp. RSA 2703]KAJ2373061.1 hypothetical protein IW150_003807 [Coemansia sp. RSA 2607]KAJ2391930.1 hypothetical protein GGI05_002817 [Coemansia sp. RSA 2603]